MESFVSEAANTFTQKINKCSKRDGEEREKYIRSERRREGEREREELGKNYDDVDGDGDGCKRRKSYKNFIFSICFMLALKYDELLARLALLQNHLFHWRMHKKIHLRSTICEKIFENDVINKIRIIARVDFSRFYFCDDFDLKKLYTIEV